MQYTWNIFLIGWGCFGGLYTQRNPQSQMLLSSSWSVYLVWTQTLLSEAGWKRYCSYSDTDGLPPCQWFASHQHAPHCCSPVIVVHQIPEQKINNKHWSFVSYIVPCAGNSEQYFWLPVLKLMTFVMFAYTDRTLLLDFNCFCVRAIAFCARAILYNTNHVQSIDLIWEALYAWNNIFECRYICTMLHAVGFQPGNKNIHKLIDSNYYYSMLFDPRCRVWEPAILIFVPMAMTTTVLCAYTQDKYLW